MNKKQLGWGNSFLVVITCLGLVPLSGWAADTPMSSWTPTTAVWTNTANWSGGVPGGSLGAVFDGTFSIQPDIATLPWSYQVKGFWLKSGVGQDVTINASTPLTVTLLSAVNNGLTAVLLMDDSGNHNLTFGPNVTLQPANGVNCYLYNAGTLTIQGALKNGGNENGFIGTSTATTVNITGQLANGGGQAITITSNTFILSSASPSFTGSVQPLAAGILREANVDALKSARANIGNGGTLQLFSDNNNDVFGSAGDIFAQNATGSIEVNRLTPSGANNTLRSSKLYIDSATLNIRGSNGYSLSISNVIAGDNWGSKVNTFNPTTANLILGSISMVPICNAVGSSSLTLDGAGSSNVVTGSILNPVGGGSSYPLIKNNSSSWTLAGTNNLTATITLQGGTLIAANNDALGFGGEARYGEIGLMNYGSDTAPAPVLNLSGVIVNKAITQNRNLATLVNSNTNTPSTMDNGLASITFTNTGAGFVGADVGKPLTISGGGGSGAAAIIAALSVNTNTFTASGGTGWYTGNFITLMGGGASQSAIYFVYANGAPGAITNLVLWSGVLGNAIYAPGYGYTSIPTNFTASKGTNSFAPTTNGTTVAFFDNFSVASVALTNAGSGYTSVPTVSLSGVSGTGFGAYANLSALAFYGVSSSVIQLGGDGNLTIKAAISGGNSSAPWYKIGTGVLTLAASNTCIALGTVSNGTLSVCNTAGSGTGYGTLTVLSNATLAGSGYIAPTPNTGVLVALQAGSHISPHVGTGVSNATLNITVGNVTSNSLDIAAGAVFDYNFAAPGVGDTLNVTGKVNLAVGTNTLNIGQLSGFGVGTYPLITSTTTVTYRTTGWILPTSTHWVYSVTNSPTSVSLKVAAAPLRATLIQIR
ncbi:MAG: hypothetical protein WCS52_14075 [bacterium]